MPYVLALAAAVCYGAADFFGGLATRRTSTTPVVIASGVAGLLALAAVLPWLAPGAPTPRDILWGVAAGVSGGTGLGLLYRALALGTMATVAPTTALCAVAVPVAVGLWRGERPAPLALAGVALALVAIALVSRAPAGGDAADRRQSIVLALLSGIAIGGFYLAMAETTAAAGMWPLAAARGTTLALYAMLALVARQPVGEVRPVLRLAAAAGVLDMAANALYVLASRAGLLSIVVTLASLYPASTVLLARVVLRERLSGPQVAGVLAALVAVALIVGAS